MIKRMIKGALIGAADPIPGVSGGTVAFATGIYDQLLDRITRFYNHPDGFKANIIWLIPFGIGLASGMFLFAHIAEWLVTTYPEITIFSFIGLVLGSLLPVLIKERPSVLGWPAWIAMSMAAMVAVGLVLMPKPGLTEAIVAPTTAEKLWIMAAGAIAAATMVVPGISGSFLQLILGTYSTYVTAIKELNLEVLIPFGFGAAVGIFTMAHLISWLFRRYYHPTLLAIAGLVLGSVIALWPGWGASPVYFTGYLLCVIGFVFGWYLTLLGESKDQL